MLDVHTRSSTERERERSSRMYCAGLPSSEGCIGLEDGHAPTSGFYSKSAFWAADLTFGVWGPWQSLVRARELLVEWVTIPRAPSI